MVARLDHAIFAVRDLQTAASRLFDELGLEAQPGGRQGDAGTGNMYVPLGDDQYIELLAVTDAASKHPMVHALNRVVADGDRLMTFALSTEDIQWESARIGEPIFDVETLGAEERHRIAFRLTGVSGLLGRELLPFFVQTTEGREWRGGFRPSKHRIEPSGVSRIEFAGDRDNILRRINDPNFPIEIVSGRSGLTAIWIKTKIGEIELRV